jgi:fatty acid desaturase
MTILGLKLVVLLFALVFYAGAGVALAHARQRATVEGDRDVGMMTIMVMLCAFGALCTAVASGLMGVLAYGGVAVWGSYVLTAQHIGLFRVETTVSSPQEEPTEARHRK